MMAAGEAVGALGAFTVQPGEPVKNRFVAGLQHGWRGSIPVAGKNCNCALEGCAEETIAALVARSASATNFEKLVMVICAFIGECDGDEHRGSDGSDRAVGPLSPRAGG